MVTYQMNIRETNQNRSGRRQAILILEDDENLAEGLCLSLHAPELEFVLCRTVAEAREALRERGFDLLILDINLPDGSGLEL